MEPIDLDDEWHLLTGFLPSDWRELAWQTGAMRRHRGSITSAEVLLRLLLLYAAGDRSFRSAAWLAAEKGLVQISDEALMKRLRTSEAWLALLAQRMFTQARRDRMLRFERPGLLFRAVDATSVSISNSPPCYWKIHYSIGLSDLRCDYFQITDARGGEELKRFPATPGDVLLADRGYCHREGVAYILRQRADAIVRLNHTSFPLLGQRSAPINILSRLRALKGLEPGEWGVQFEAFGKRLPARLCAVRKTKAIAAESRAKLQREAGRKKVHPDTLEAAGYIFVLATEGVTLSPQEVLEAYRLRWQIELVFKRLKSLLHLDLLREKKPPGGKAWIQAKLLVALFVERLLAEGRCFSPWGHDGAAPQRVAEVPAML